MFLLKTLTFFRYFVYLAVIFAISYGNRDPNAYFEKYGLETAVIYGGLNCENVPPDDSNWRPCKNLKNRHTSFMNVIDANGWWDWFETTLLPQVRVQPWYNGAPPYGLRGFLDDKVNRIIGYAIVRQTRERPNSCKYVFELHNNQIKITHSKHFQNRPARVVRDAIPECTGENGMAFEDHRNWCQGWVPLSDENCVEADEFKYVSQETLKSRPITLGVQTHGGGGYILKLTGFIGDLKARVQMLKDNAWIDNRTRSINVEFSVYNTQVLN